MWSSTNKIRSRTAFAHSILSHLLVLCILFVFTRAEKSSHDDVTEPVVFRKCDNFISSLHKEVIHIPSHLIASTKNYPNGFLSFRLEPQRKPCGRNTSFIEIPMEPPLDTHEKITTTMRSLETGPPTFQFLVDLNSSTTENSISVTSGPIVTTTTYDISSTTRRTSFRPQLQFTENGFFVWNDEYFDSDDFCINEISENYLSLSICPVTCKGSLDSVEENSGESIPCIPLCCHMGQVIDWNREVRGCRSSGDKIYMPTFYNDLYTKVEPQTPIKVHYHRVRLNCRSKDGVSNDPFEPWSFRDLPDLSLRKTPMRVLKNGQIYYVGTRRKWAPVPPGPSCLTGIQNFGEKSLYTGDEKDQLYIRCSQPVDTERPASIYYVVGFIIASVFLLLTAIVYLILFDKQNVHGFSLLSLVISMFLLFVMLAVSHLIGEMSAWYLNLAQGGHHAACVATAVLIHFFFLSTFCWLSVINFDLWWTFRSLAPLSERSRGMKRFVAYLIFALGIPTIVIIVGFVLTQLFPDRESLVVIPEYGTINCFMPEWSKGHYLYYIIGVLLLLNCVFIVMTLYNFYLIKKSTRAIQGSRSKKQTQSFKLFSKLFVLMGITWVFEILSWWSEDENQRSPWYYHVADFVNLSQAIGIFIIFVCKKQVVTQLKQKMQKLSQRISFGQSFSIGADKTGGTMSTSASGRSMKGPRHLSSISIGKL